MKKILKKLGEQMNCQIQPISSNANIPISSFEDTPM